MNLTDDEISTLHGMYEDWIQSSDFWTDEDRGVKSELFGKVMDEAKRRGLWWAK
jgi:hypothetical protein